MLFNTRTKCHSLQIPCDKEESFFEYLVAFDSQSTHVEKHMLDVPSPVHFSLAFHQHLQLKDQNSTSNQQERLITKRFQEPIYNDLG